MAEPVTTDQIEKLLQNLRLDAHAIIELNLAKLLTPRAIQELKDRWDDEFQDALAEVKERILHG